MTVSHIFLATSVVIVVDDVDVVQPFTFAKNKFTSCFFFFSIERIFAFANYFSTLILTTNEARKSTFARIAYIYENRILQRFGVEKLQPMRLFAPFFNQFFLVNSLPCQKFFCLCVCVSLSSIHILFRFRFCSVYLCQFCVCSTRAHSVSNPFSVVVVVRPRRIDCAHSKTLLISVMRWLYRYDCSILIQCVATSSDGKYFQSRQRNKMARKKLNGVADERDENRDQKLR